MTDKQIIIDGVDVSGCRYYDDRDGYCDACKDDIDGNSYTKCMYEDNCYYKQLKRAENRIVDLNKTIKTKEQECETLASQLDFEVQKKECLEQECEELKNFHINLVGVKECEIRELVRYKQALAEIKDIAQDFGFNGIYEDCFTGIQKILQICDEVLSE